MLGWSPSVRGGVVFGAGLEGAQRSAAADPAPDSARLASGYKAVPGEGSEGSISDGRGAREPVGHVLRGSPFGQGERGASPDHDESTRRGRAGQDRPDRP